MGRLDGVRYSVGERPLFARSRRSVSAGNVSFPLDAVAVVAVDWVLTRAPLPLGAPVGERRERRVRRRLRDRRDELRSGLARIGIEAKGEELRSDRAEVDLAVDNRIGIILVGKR